MALLFPDDDPEDEFRLGLFAREVEGLVVAVLDRLSRIFYRD